MTSRIGRENSADGFDQPAIDGRRLRSPDRCREPRLDLPGLGILHKEKEGGLHEARFLIGVHGATRRCAPGRSQPGEDRDGIHAMRFVRTLIEQRC